MKIYLIVIVLIYTLGDNIFQYLPTAFHNEPPIFSSALVNCFNFGRNAPKETNNFYNHRFDFPNNHNQRITSSKNMARMRRTNIGDESTPPQKLETAVFENEVEMLRKGRQMETGVLAYVRSLNSFFGKLLGGWSPFTMGYPIVEDSPIAEAHTSIGQDPIISEEIQNENEDDSIKDDDFVDIPMESESNLIGSVLSTVDPASIATEGERKGNTEELDEAVEESSKDSAQPTVITEDEELIPPEDTNLIDKVMTSKERLHSANENGEKILEFRKDDEINLNGISKTPKPLPGEKELLPENKDENQFPPHKMSESEETHSKETVSIEDAPTFTDEAQISNKFNFLRLVAINDAMTGNLRGIDKINYQCQREAFEAGLDGLFRAFLSSEGLHLHNILSPVDSVDKMIANSEGDVLFKSYQHLISMKGKFNITNIIAPIYSFNKKNIIFDEHWPFNLVWTGHEDNEFKNGNIKRCNEWTSEDPYLKGVTSDYLFKGLLYTREEPCDDTFIVLCLELGSEKYINVMLNEEEYSRELEAYYEPFAREYNLDTDYAIDNNIFNEKHFMQYSKFRYYR